MIRSSSLKITTIASILALSAAAALAQFTPGAGGTYTTPTPPTSPTPPYQMQPNDAVRVIEAPSAPVPMVAQPAVPQLNEAQLADLTASIALYPDPLLGEMLPASTYVEELSYADKWLEQHPGADEQIIANLPLDPSVKAIMHYPQVLNLLTDHLDWTQSVGLAFMYQRADLMGMIQRWRFQAVGFGTLASSPQQQVLQQGNTILIVPPPTTNVVYVPVYDPAVVFVRPVRPVRDIITFRAGGFSLSWVDNDIDWRGHEVRVPVRDIHDRDHPIGGGIVVDIGGDRGHDPHDRAAFVHDSDQPHLMYPQRIVTPQPDHKVVTIQVGPGRGDRGRGDDHNH